MKNLLFATETQDHKQSHFVIISGSLSPFLAKTPRPTGISDQLMNASSIVWFVYFNCRGAGHFYRYLIYEIGMPFQEIHVDSNGKLPECIQNFDIKMSDIPCVIYQGKVMKELYPTLRFLCNKFNRQDLLGNTLQEQTLISEIFCKNSKKKSQLISIFLKHLISINKEPQNVYKIKQEMLKQLSDTDGINYCCCMLYSQTGSFLFDHITIADFLFYQSCFYFANLLGDVAKRNFQINFAYKNFFERTQFYKTHQNRIQSFKIALAEFDQSLNEGFRLMFWRDKKFLN